MAGKYRYAVFFEHHVSTAKPRGCVYESFVPVEDFAGRIPLQDQPLTWTEDSDSPLTAPDMVRSGRVLPTSVKSPFCYEQ